MSTGLLARLLKHERGAAVIEMALVAPVLALGVIGIVDVSNAYSKKLALEQGAQRAIEKIMDTTENSTVESTLAKRRSVR
jgi:Flp pilus assembly protein TadG